MPVARTEKPNTGTETNGTPQKGEGHQPDREVRHEYAPGFPELLERLGISLLVSTYQAGKVATVGVANHELALGFHNFDKAMGITRTPTGLAVASRTQVWLLNTSPEIASLVAPAGTHDACFLTRKSHYTGDIQAHELAWARNELWCVNTAFSCLCTFDDQHSFVPRWIPPFVSTLAAEDRCHLNGLAVADGVPRYVTAMAETDTAQAWRANKVSSGCLIEIASGATVVRGFAMPHSPRVRDGHVWLLNSGAGQLVRVDVRAGRADVVAHLPGYTRGLALHDRYAFIGLSKIRETSTFGGMPIAERRAELKCGVGVIDLETGALAAHLEFTSGVEEIFDVHVLPGVRNPVLSGPYASLEGAPPIWLVPRYEPKKTSK